MATTIMHRVVSAGFSMSAQRLLVFGGIALIAGGMFFGDIFAVFVLHQNVGETGTALLAATQAAAAQNPAAVKEAFTRIGGLLEDRGTKVDTHVHLTDAGYLALLLALAQPYVGLSAARKKLLARLFLVGGLLLPIGIFLIHYVGLAYSPSPVIGWASILADSAGALMIVVVIGEAWGLWTYFRTARVTLEDELPQETSWERRVLLSGSLILPIFVLLELKIGLVAGGIADLGGLMVIVALIGMLVGVLRYSGSIDAQAGGLS